MIRPVPLDLAHAFARFRSADPDRLHFAAHSHHLWPDVTRDAQIEAWDDAARLADDKWEMVLDDVWREVAAGIARHLNLPDPGTLVPAPNTHELVNRLISACPADRPVRVLTTDGEFHSWRRQIERLAEEGLVICAVISANRWKASPSASRKPVGTALSTSSISAGSCSGRATRSSISIASSRRSPRPGASS
jgi:kynureninase